MPDGIDVDVQLKPCPFCTCKAVELETVEDGDGNLLCAHVECPACLARGPQEALIQNAVVFWNEADTNASRFGASVEIWPVPD